RAIPAFPQCSRVKYPIPDGPAVRSFAARNGARDADKLRAHLLGRQLDLRITVSSEIDELEVRSEIRVGQRPCAPEVEALGIFKARADAVPHQHVVRPLGLRAVRPVGEEQRAQRMDFGKTVLLCFHGSRARQRGADEAQAYGIELAWRQLRG